MKNIFAAKLSADTKLSKEQQKKIVGGNSDGVGVERSHVADHPIRDLP